LDLSGTGSKMDLLIHMEKEVLKYNFARLTSEEIAIELYVSKRTVDVTRISIKNKLALKPLTS
jgi:FixJ family two-component response regulator